MKPFEKFMAKAIGEIMIGLGQEHDMDLDVNLIDYEALYEKAKKKVMKDPEFIKAWEEDRASEWLIDDEDGKDIRSQIDLIKGEPHSARYETLGYLEGVYCCEAAEYMTVEQFCEYIDPRYTF